MLETPLSLKSLTQELETERFQLEEAMKVLSHKIRRSEPRDSIASAAWKATLQKYEVDHQRLLRELEPLRRDTMQPPCFERV